MSINAVALSGNITRQPELRTSNGGSSILSFGIAVNERRRNQRTGEWEDRPNFVDCVMFGKRAESLSGILSKGMKVSLQGRLSYSSWKAKDGSARSKIEVVVDEIELPQRPRGQGQGQPSFAAPPRQAHPDDVYDEDVPF